jgi:hypothetical protein
MPTNIYTAEDPFRCTTGANDGGSHHWSYLGKSAQAYQCDTCAGRISKDVLKEETDA